MEKALAAVPDSLFSQPVAAWAVVAALLVALLTAVLEFDSRYVTACAADEGALEAEDVGALPSSLVGAFSLSPALLAGADSNSLESRLFLRAVGFIPDNSAAADKAEAATDAAAVVMEDIAPDRIAPDVRGVSRSGE